MNGYLGEWRGQLCVVDSFNQEHEPIKTILYWPTDIKVKDFIHIYGDHLIGNKVSEHSMIEATYRIENPSSYELLTQLKNGNQTKPIHVENEPIPKPKVREGIELRYTGGKWQKHLKTQGWVSARTAKKSAKRCKK